MVVCMMGTRLTSSEPDLQHHLALLSLDGKLCLAPFKETATVLDIGTGTGIWAIQLARSYPRTKASSFSLRYMEFKTL